MTRKTELSDQVRTQETRQKKSKRTSIQKLVKTRKTEEYMLDYLGFPHQQEDVSKFVEAVDKLETDGKISPEEFLKVVGNFGGCCKLFEMRRGCPVISYKMDEHGGCHDLFSFRSQSFLWGMTLDVEASNVRMSWRNTHGP